MRVGRSCCECCRGYVDTSKRSEELRKVLPTLTLFLQIIWHPHWIPMKYHAENLHQKPRFAGSVFALSRGGRGQG